MRLAFDLTSVAKEQRGGIATYGWELVRAVVRAQPQREFVLSVRPNRWFKRKLVGDILQGIRPPVRTRLLLDPIADGSLGRPDVLHAIGIRLPARMKAARVVTVHDTNVFEYPEASDERWRQKRQARIRQTLARADLVIAYSEQGRQALAERLNFPADRVRIVPCGVDTTRFRPLTSQEVEAVLRRRRLVTAEGSPRPYVLLVGEWSLRKNQAGLIAAFARASREGAIPPSWALVLAGPRDAAAEGVRRLAREAGLADDRVLLPGWVPDEDLPALMCGATIYVCSSLHEGFGLPVLEAQACGAPVLCSDRGGLKETLGGCGVLFDPDDAAAFAAGLARLAGDGALRAELARRGPARVTGSFTWDEVAKRTLAVYGEAAQMRR
jgi:glycosyltransferase involved in cell wall biosynthesis